MEGQINDWGAVGCYLVSESTITAGWMTWAQVATLTIPQPSAFRTSVGMPASPFRISLSVPGTLPLSGIADPFPCVPFNCGRGACSWGGA